VQLDDDLRAFIQAAFQCPPEVTDRIGARASDRRFPARAMILRQGDPAGETVLLVEGCAHALVYGADGQTVLLQAYNPGDLFGAVAATGPQPHEADVVAVEDSRAAWFLALDFLALIESHASVGLAVSRQLLKQLRAASGRMVEQVTLSAVGRIHAELLRLAAQSDDGATIAPAPVLSALAVRVHSTRETVSRTISALERRGLLRREDDALLLTAPQRLEALVV
jgi:CRP/FNR family cyclic AMP-dependent transcriptional regulator